MTEYVGPMPRVRSRGHIGAVSDALSDSARHGTGGPGGADIFDLLPINTVTNLVPIRGVSVGGVKKDQPPGSLYPPPRAVHHCNPGGG